MSTTRGYLFDCTANKVYLNNNRYASKQNSCVIIRQPKNLMERYGLMGLVTVAESIGVEVNDAWNSDDLTAAVWAKFKEITSDQIRDERRAKREASGKDTGERRGPGNLTSGPRRRRWPRVYKICFQAISEELRPTGGSRFPLQARTILDQLRSQSSELFTEEELKAFIANLAEKGILVGRTRANGQVDPLQQDPWTVFLYYEAKFHQYGFIRREILPLPTLETMDEWQPG